MSGLTGHIKRPFLDPQTVYADADTTMTAPLTVLEPVEPGHAARLIDVQNLKAEIHRDAHHADVDVFVTDVGEIPEEAGKRFIPRIEGLGITTILPPSAGYASVDLSNTELYRFSTIGATTIPAADVGYVIPTSIKTNESHPTVDSESLRVTIKTEHISGPSYGIVSNYMSKPEVQAYGFSMSNGTHSAIFTDAIDFASFIEGLQNELAEFDSTTEVAFQLDGSSALSSNDFFRLSGTIELTKNLPYTVEADGSWTPDAQGVENGDDVKVLVADSALDDDENAEETLTYFYSIGEWTELPAGADIATIASNIRTAIDNINVAAAGTAIVEVDGKHHFDPLAVLKGGEGEIDAAKLALSVETTAFQTPEDGKIGTYVSAIDMKFRRLRRYGFSYDLTPSDVATATSPLKMPDEEEDGYSYELDTSHLSSATMNVGTGAHTHGNGWEIMAQGDDFIISWQNNEFLKNVFQSNPDTQFSIDVVIPVK